MMLAMVLLQSSRTRTLVSTSCMVELRASSFFCMISNLGNASLHRITEVLDTEVSLTDDGCKRPEKKVESGKIEFFSGAPFPRRPADF